MMLPRSILDKMRLGVGATSLLWAMGYSGNCEAEEGAPAAPPVAVDRKEPKFSEEDLKELRASTPKVGENELKILRTSIPRLSEEELKILRTSIPNLGDDELKIREAAYKSILALGKGANKPLREALKTATDLEIKHALNRLLAELNPKPASIDRTAPCAGCSRG